MDNFDFDDVLNATIGLQDTLDDRHDKQKESIEQERHDEKLAALQEVNSHLQTQIDDNRKEIENAKLTEKKHSRRSWIQFGISLGVSFIGVVISIIALCLSITK